MYFETELAGILPRSEYGHRDVKAVLDPTDGEVIVLIPLHDIPEKYHKLIDDGEFENDYRVTVFKGTVYFKYSIGKDETNDLLEVYNNTMKSLRAFLDKYEQMAEDFQKLVNLGLVKLPVNQAPSPKAGDCGIRVDSRICDKKINLIKVIRRYKNNGLKEAKDELDSGTVKFSNISFETANQIKDDILAEVGNLPYEIYKQAA